MFEHNAVVRIFNSNTEAETSITELQRARFGMKKLSIVGKDYHTEEHVVGNHNAVDRMKVWGKQGAFWGGLWGLLFGSALFVARVVHSGGWSFYAAAFSAICSSVLIPENHRLKVFLKSSFRTCTRVCNSRCAPRWVQLLLG
jgi:uncharacterized membrane protein